MGMLDKKKGKGLLERKPNPIISNQVDRNELNITKILSNSDYDINKLGIVSETERATIKTDNHIRNAISALVNTGEYDSQKDALEKMVEEKISSLSDDVRKRFEYNLDTLELKDYNKQQRKKK